MKEVIIEIIEEILDREITLDSIEILTLEIEVMVRMTGIVPSVIILISQEEPSVIDAVNHVQEDQEEILEVAVTVDVGILEEAEIESVEILEEETMEIVGKEMEEILERHLLIMTGIVLNAIIQIFRRIDQLIFDSFERTSRHAVHVLDRCPRSLACCHAEMQNTPPHQNPLHYYSLSSIHYLSRAANALYHELETARYQCPEEFAHRENPDS